MVGTPASNPLLESKRNLRFLVEKWFVCLSLVDSEPEISVGKSSHLSTSTYPISGLSYIKLRCLRFFFSILLPLSENFVKWSYVLCLTNPRAISLNFRMCSGFCAVWWSPKFDYGGLNLNTRSPNHQIWKTRIIAFRKYFSPSVLLEIPKYWKLPQNSYTSSSFAHLK